MATIEALQPQLRQLKLRRFPLPNGLPHRSRFVPA